MINLLRNKETLLFQFIENGENKTRSKKEIVQQFQHWYYYNASFYLGNRLKTMIERKLIVREKRGFYKIRDTPIKYTDENQLNLFN